MAYSYKWRTEDSHCSLTRTRSLRESFGNNQQIYSCKEPCQVLLYIVQRFIVSQRRQKKTQQNVKNIDHSINQHTANAESHPVGDTAMFVSANTFVDPGVVGFGISDSQGRFTIFLEVYLWEQ